jgi:hypothetical protein
MSRAVVFSVAIAALPATACAQVESRTYSARF